MRLAQRGRTSGPAFDGLGAAKRLLNSSLRLGVGRVPNFSVVSAFIANLLFFEVHLPDAPSLGFRRTDAASRICWSLPSFIVT